MSSRFVERSDLNLLGIGQKHLSVFRCALRSLQRACLAADYTVSRALPAASTTRAKRFAMTRRPLKLKSEDESNSVSFVSERRRRTLSMRDVSEEVQLDCCYFANGTNEVARDAFAACKNRKRDASIFPQSSMGPSPAPAPHGTSAPRKFAS